MQRHILLFFFFFFFFYLEEIREKVIFQFKISTHSPKNKAFYYYCKVDVSSCEILLIFLHCFLNFSSVGANIDINKAMYYVDY